MVVKIEELRKKATLLRWAIAGVLDVTRTGAITNPEAQLGPIEDLATEIETALEGLLEKDASELRAIAAVERFFEAA